MKGAQGYRCEVQRRCGGCACVAVPYEEQLARKQRRIEELFAELLGKGTVRPILGMDEPFHYRNKVATPYAPARKTKGRQKGGRSERSRGSERSVLTGMYARGTHELIPTDACAIENRSAKAATLAVRDLMERWDIAPYDEDAHRGFMRHSVVRVGHASGEMLVTLVTNAEEFPRAKSFCRELVRRVPAITTVVQNVNTRKTNVILGERERVLYGPGFILDELCGVRFRISSRSFYQVNAEQTAVLYEAAMGLGRVDELGASDRIIDAYCGTGTIGLVAAHRSGAALIGVDSVASAIHDAKQNARHNGIENAAFLCADATAYLKDLAAEEAVRYGGFAGRTVLFLDPPRAGSTPEFIDAACSLAPERIVYIACDPATQARDVARFCEGGYEVVTVQPVDMFPHTDHIENICLLERPSAEERTSR